LKNSNTFRERRATPLWSYRWLLATLAVGLVGTCGASNAETATSQYVHDWWGIEQGFPGGAVYDIAQTPDGYLWIGTQQGLVRFDGLNFILFQQANGEKSPSGPVLSLITDAEGSLWIRQHGLTLLRYRDGKFEDFLPFRGRREISITAMALGKDGEVLLSGLLNGPMAYKAGGFQTLVERGQPSPMSISLAETAGGRVWMGTRDAGLYYASGRQNLGVVQGLPDQKINCLLGSSGQELWIGTDNGVVRWNGVEALQTGLPRSLSHVRVLAMTKDRESNIWVGSSSGLFRLNTTDGSSFEESDQKSIGVVTALFEDREGNVWAGTTQGLERLRHTDFTTYYGGEGLPSETNGPLYVDSGGRMWFAPMEGGLYWLRDGQLGRVSNAGLERDVVYSIAGGKDELWVGRQRGGLTHLRYKGTSVTSETYREMDGLAQNSVFAVHQNRDGTVWAGTLSAGVSHFKNGKFTTYTTQNGLASNTVTSIVEGSDGTMWFGTPNGLSAMSKGQWRVYTSRDGLPPGTVNCLFQDSAGVLWIGTANGLAFFDAGVIRTPREEPASLLDQIFGIEEDKTGSLFIATSNHLLRVNREKLLSLSLGDGDMREYGLADGLRGTRGVNRYRSVVADSLGRMWISTNRGISFLDQPRTLGDSPPAMVHIEGISADGRQFNIGEQLRIPTPHQRITLSYSGLSLSVPARIRFKYRLDGFDSAWSDPTASREAVYTNLGARRYRFRVIASNSDGLWNSSESALQFEVDPAFWQTWWFRLSALSVLALLLWTLNRLRLKQLERQFTLALGTRVDERVRIARELHDTLLQSFHGLMFQFQAARNLLPRRPESAIQALDEAIVATEQALAEGRDAIRDLRPDAAAEHDLAELLTAAGHELAGIHPANGHLPGFRVIVEGKPRKLSPTLQDEIYRIGSEVIRNAFNHAVASNIEVEIRYDEHELRLRIRDDGKGIDPKDLEGCSRPGHWGLQGIRERAQQTGSRLNFWSEPGAGTEVELRIPAAITYEKERRGHRFRFYYGGSNGKRT
jgi:signal transduction histidine kinase/ligand-binding sensor domain-containing protein